MAVDIRKVRKLIELIEQTGVTEIEIKEGEETVRISKGAIATPAAQPVSHIMAAPAPQAQHQVASQSQMQASQPAEEKEEASGHKLTSPMVGTIYLAPAPGKPPFVEIGQQVSAGDPLCTIEAMKMFNEIEADRAGVVRARLVENGQPVEYGQPLFIIE